MKKTADKVNILTSQHKIKMGTEDIFKFKSIKGMFMLSINMCNSILGGGIIALPEAVKMSGIGMGIILQSIASGMCGFTFIALGYCCEYTKAKTYSEMVSNLLGQTFRYITMISTLIFSISCGIAYSMAVADNIQSVFMGIWPESKIIHYRAVILIFPLYIIAFPLCILKSVKYLEKISTISIGLVIMYISAFVWRLKSIPYQIQPIREFFSFSGNSVIESLPIFAFASSCHQNALNFYYSLKDSSTVAFALSTNVAIMFTNLLYIIVAVVGFITFGGDPPDNIFLGYCSNDVLINVMRIIFALTIILTLPFQVFPPRTVIMNLFFKKHIDNNYLKAGVSFLIITISYVTASVFRDISVVLKISGALTNVPILYIMPCMCLLKVIGKPYISFDFRRIMCWLCLAWGTSIFFISPILTVRGIINHSNKELTEKYYCVK